MAPFRFLKTLCVAVTLVVGAFITQPQTAQAGERVVGQWSDGYWYPAQITGYDRQGYSLLFDDGDRARLASSQVRPFTWQPGTRVQCRWQGGRTYYNGVVAAISGNNVLIHYDDGDREQTNVVWCRSAYGGGGAVAPSHLRDSSSGVPDDPEEFLRAIERNRGR
jgi:hypothetical protein